MRRLFSTFAPGAPGAGLLLLRVAVGSALLVHALANRASLSDLASGVLGVLLIVGLWTPVAGVLAALVAAWIGWREPAALVFWSLVGTVGIALALVGPGVWSADARLFGWKRVDLRGAKGPDSPPD